MRAATSFYRRPSVKARSENPALPHKRAGVGKGAGGGRLGWTKNFFAGFPIPRSPLPQKLGTDPTIVNKIKGLRGFGGRVEGGEGAGVGGGEGLALGEVWG